MCRKLVKDMCKERLLASALIALFAVATSQMCNVKAASTRDFTLYGSFSQGWGFTVSNITSPGPTIVVEQGDTVNLTLISNDGITHRFFVSYTNATSPNSTEPQSSDFTGTIDYQFVATEAVGTYTYACLYHYSMMNGVFQVVPTGTIPEFQPIVLFSLLIASTTGVALLRRRKRQN